MKYRKLRIAWSVVWIVVSLLILALWIGSYYQMSGFWRVNQKSTRLTSAYGSITFFHGVIVGDGAPEGWQTVNFPYSSRTVERMRQRRFERLWFKLALTGSQFAVQVPYWFLTLTGSALAALPWFVWHFSLRALLIATTLIAVVLGIAAISV